MQEVTKTLKELFTNNEWGWKETTVGIRENEITFRRLEPTNLKTRFVGNETSIEFCKVTNILRTKNLARYGYNEVVGLNIWQLFKPRTDDRQDELNDLRQKIIDEVRRIIKASSRHLKDIRFSYAGNETFLDELDEDPPVLHCVMNIHCIFTDTS